MTLARFMPFVTYATPERTSSHKKKELKNEKNCRVVNSIFLSFIRNSCGSKESNFDRVSVDPVNAECPLVSEEFRAAVHNGYN